MAAVETGRVDDLDGEPLTAAFDGPTVVIAGHRLDLEGAELFAQYAVRATWEAGHSETGKD